MIQTEEGTLMGFAKAHTLCPSHESVWAFSF